MQLALRPYVTTGVAIVGASVIAVAPIVPTPTEIQVPNPLVQVDRAVTLTANEIEGAVNQLIFAATDIGLRLATLPAPLVAQILGISNEEAQAFLALGTVGLLGSLISGTGATGTGIQDIVNELGGGDVAGLLNSLIGFPATIIDGIVNGGYGPDLSPLLAEAVAGVLSEALGIPIPPEAIGTVLAGGLINEFTPLSLAPPIGVIVSGLFPTLQGLVDRLLGSLTGGGDEMLAAAAVVPVESEGAIEGAINALLLNLVARPIVTVAGLLGTILAPVLGEEEAALLPIAALGLFGPLISGPGAVGTAIQDVVDSLGSGNFAGVLSELIGAPATVIDGVVNGGYGPDLAGLVVPLLFPGLPSELFPDVRAGGLINELDVQLVEVPFPPFFLPTGVTLPGTIPTLQGLVNQILGLIGLASPEPEALPVETLSEAMSIDSVDTSDKKLVTLDVAADLGEETHGKHAAPDVTPAGPKADLTAGLPTDANVPAKVEEIKAAIDTEKGPDVGKKVSEAARPDTAQGPPAGPRTDTDTLDTTDGAKFEPETTVTEAGDNGDKKAGGGSNQVGAAISSVAKGFAGAVKSALGG